MSEIASETLYMTHKLNYEPVYVEKTNTRINDIENNFYALTVCK